MDGVGGDIQGSLNKMMSESSYMVQQEGQGGQSSTERRHGKHVVRSQIVSPLKNPIGCPDPFAAFYTP